MVSHVEKTWHMLSNKDQLAKLLATENITIRRSVRAETASFDLVNRVLTLPVLKVTSGDILDMMTGHEVGHALWTDLVEWAKAIDEDRIHKQVLNIVEDARIEKKLKRKYPGIVKSFITGYAELANKGFFGDDKPDLSMSLIDRINLHAKMGYSGNIPFSEDEQWAVDAVAGVETFEDAKRVAKMLQMDYVEFQETQDAHAAWAFSDGDEGEAMEGGEEYDIDEGEDEDNGEMPVPYESKEQDPEDFDGSTTDDIEDDAFNTESTFEDKKKEQVFFIGKSKPKLRSLNLPVACRLDKMDANDNNR